MGHGRLLQAEEAGTTLLFVCAEMPFSLSCKRNFWQLSLSLHPVCWLCVERGGVGTCLVDSRRAYFVWLESVSLS